MTNAEHLLRFHRFQKSREKFYAPKIEAALNNQYKQFTDNIHLGLNALDYISSDELVKIVRNIYMDAGIVYGAKIRADLVKQVAIKRVKALAGFDDMEVKNRRAIGFSERMAQLIADYFKEDIFETVKNITDTTKEIIKKVLTNAYALGQGISDIVDQLLNTEISKVRARLIARTETVTAANKGAMFVAKDTGLTLNKIWLSAGDSRVRRDHAEINGHTVGIDDAFTVGGYKMQQPGDSSDGADGSEIINCRCTVIFRKAK